MRTALNSPIAMKVCYNFKATLLFCVVVELVACCSPKILGDWTIVDVKSISQSRNPVEDLAIQELALNQVYGGQVVIRKDSLIMKIDDKVDAMGITKITSDRIVGVDLSGNVDSLNYMIRSENTCSIYFRNGSHVTLTRRLLD